VTSQNCPLIGSQYRHFQFPEHYFIWSQVRPVPRIVVKLLTLKLNQLLPFLTTIIIYRVSIKSLAGYKHLLQENYPAWNTNIFFLNVNQEAFFTTHLHTSACAPFVARRTSNR